MERPIIEEIFPKPPFSFRVPSLTRKKLARKTIPGGVSSLVCHTVHTSGSWEYSQGACADWLDACRWFNCRTILRTIPGLHKLNRLKGQKRVRTKKAWESKSTTCSAREGMRIPDVREDCPESAHVHVRDPIVDD